MLIVSALLATASAKTLTLSEVRGMYNNAVQNAHVEAATEVSALQIKYTIALRKYYRHLSENAKTKEDLADLVVIRKEIEQLANLKGKDLPAVDPYAGKELLKLRQTYKTARVNIEKSKEAKLVELKGTLSTTLAKLQKELLAKGETEKALQVFDAIVEVDGKPVNEYEESTKDQSVGLLVRQGQAYARAVSKQVINLRKDTTYEFVVKFITEEGSIDKQDPIPEWLPLHSTSWQPGPEWELIKMIEESKVVEVKKDKFGWFEATVQFKSSVDAKLRFGMATYGNSRTYFKDFSLVNVAAPLDNLFNRDMTQERMWEKSPDLGFAVGVNKAGK